MSAENSESINPFEYAPDLFAEPHDHANLWDISAFWFDELLALDTPVTVKPNDTTHTI